MFLIASIHSENERFEHYFNKYYKYACKVCLNIVHNTDIVEDIITTSFFKAYNRLSEMTSEKEAKIWIAAIVRNESKNYLKSISRENMFLSESYDEIMLDKSNFSDNPLERLLVTEAIEEIYNEILKMSTKMADTMMMFYKSELNIKEIAAILDVPEKTIYTRIERGTEKLKQALLKKSEVKYNEQ